MTETLERQPTEGKITDEAIAEVRKMIGLKLRPEQYLRDASVDTITNFSNGMGDINPLYRDVEYARWTKYGGLVAHPTFCYTHHWPGRTRWGLPGVHGFGVGNDMEFYRVVRPGDRLSIIDRVAGIVEKQGRFSGRMVITYEDARYFNQRGEMICKVLGWNTRHERKAARDKGKYSGIQTHQYTEEEMDEIYKQALLEGERIRGSETRYWEDVEINETLPDIVRGPLSLQDTIGWLVACGRGHTHGVLLREAIKHPAHYFKNPEAGGGLEYTGIGHHRESIAKEVGVPGMYDYLNQRVSWLASLVCNWMGEDAFLKRIRGQADLFNIQGDTQWCKGNIINKYKKDGYALVDIDVKCVNQRGETTMPGIATVMLPSKDLSCKPVMDGSDLELNAWSLPIE